MIVEYFNNEKSLTVKPVGRMDTITSPELNECTKPKMEGIHFGLIDQEK